jgi:hypothetical protein
VRITIKITQKRLNVLKKFPRLGAANQHKLIWTSSRHGEAGNSPRRCVTTYRLLGACLLDIYISYRGHVSTLLVHIPWMALSWNVDYQGLDSATECHGQDYLEISKAKVLGIAMGGAITKHRLPGTFEDWWWGQGIWYRLCWEANPKLEIKRKKRENSPNKQNYVVSHKNSLQIEPMLKYVTSTGALTAESNKP